MSNMDATVSSPYESPRVVVPSLFFAAAVLIWANWNSPFYNYDDADHEQQATENSIAWIFSLGSGQTFMPVTWLSMRLDRALFGPPFSEKYFSSTEEGGAPLDPVKFRAQRLWATGSRVESAILHALAGVALWYFLRRIGATPRVAFFVAVAWTGHPMACESVCWISERKNVLSALFGFGAMLAWTAPRGTWWRWPLVSLLYLLSTTSKPTGVGFFPVLAALEIIQPLDGSTEWKSVRGWLSILGRLAGPGLITVLIVWAGISMHRVHFVEHAGGSLFNALLTDVDIVSSYMLNTLFAVNLSFFYGVDPVRSISDSRVWIYGPLIVGTIVLLIAVTEGRERRLTIFGIVWFFAALGPVANIAPIPFWMHDRYVYTAAPGWLLAVVLGYWGVIKWLLLERHARRFELSAESFGATLLFFLLLSTARRSTDFIDTERLSFQAANLYPNSSFALVNAYAGARYRLDDAATMPGPEVVETRALYLKKADAYFAAAIAREDLTQFREAFKFRVDHAELLLQNGKLDKALDCLTGFLPPAHLAMRDVSQEFRGAEFKTYYAPQTLARAWLIHAQVTLSRANPPEMTLVALPVKRRFELCDEAEASLTKSLAVFDWNGQAQFLLAAVDLTRAEIAKLGGQAAEAAAFSVSARRKLEAIPPRSPYYANARQLLGTLGR
ncbi:MAG: hypothetical protein WCT04_19375 [Planctomycetota bacterium]